MRIHRVFGVMIAAVMACSLPAYGSERQEPLEKELYELTKEPCLTISQLAFLEPIVGLEHLRCNYDLADGFVRKLWRLKQGGKILAEAEELRQIRAEIFVAAVISEWKEGRAAEEDKREARDLLSCYEFSANSPYFRVSRKDVKVFLGK